jgi:hypothetical protein
VAVLSSALPGEVRPSAVGPATGSESLRSTLWTLPPAGRLAVAASTKRSAATDHRLAVGAKEVVRTPGRRCAHAMAVSDFNGVMTRQERCLAVARSDGQQSTLADVPQPPHVTLDAAPDPECAGSQASSPTWMSCRLSWNGHPSRVLGTGLRRRTHAHAQEPTWTPARRGRRRRPHPGSSPAPLTRPFEILHPRVRHEAGQQTAENLPRLSTC